MKHKFLISTAVVAVTAILYPANADTLQNSTQTPHVQADALQLAQEKGGSGMGGGMSGGGTSSGGSATEQKGGTEKGMHRGEKGSEKGMERGEKEMERGEKGKKGAMEKGKEEKGSAQKEEKGEQRRGAQGEKSEKSTQKNEGRDREKMTRDRDREKSGTAEKDHEKGSDRTTTRSMGGGGKSVQLNSSQQTRIKTVIKNENVAHLSRTQVNFSINVGTRVPSSVHLVVLPPTIVEIVPEYRGYYYVVIEDDLLIIDPGTREIVAVIRLA
jgi:hypothetical protein